MFLQATISSHRKQWFSVNFQMCLGKHIIREQTVSKVLDTNGDIVSDEEEVNSSLNNLPSHADNPFLNCDLKNGVLGFRCENKKETIVIYSSIESKTFCTLMKLRPLIK